MFLRVKFDARLVQDGAKTGTAFFIPVPAKRLEQGEVTTQGDFSVELPVDELMALKLGKPGDPAGTGDYVFAIA